MSVIDYHQPNTPPTKSIRRWPFRMVVVVAGAFALFASLFFDASQTQLHVDPLTGSRWRQTVWFGHFSLGPTITVSPLEPRLKQLGISWKPTWDLLSEIDYNLLGQVTCRDCSTTPPMFHFDSFGAAYLAVASDDEVRAFFNTIQTGTADEQRKAIVAAGDRTYEASFNSLSKAQAP